MDDLEKQIAKIGFSKVSRQQGLNFEALKARYSGGGLDRFLVAVKEHDRMWPAKYQEAISIARAKYDRGSHEMCQGRSGKYTILYLIPRLVWAKPRQYFRTMTPNQ